MKSLPSIPHRHCGNIFLPLGDNFCAAASETSGGIDQRVLKLWSAGFAKLLVTHFSHEFWHDQGWLVTTVFEHWFGLQWNALTIIWPYWNLEVGRRQYQCSLFPLALYDNYCRHKTETALHYSHTPSLLLHMLIWPPLLSRGNIITSHAMGPGSIPSQVISWLRSFLGFSLSHKTNVRKFGPHSSPVITWPSYIIQIIYYLSMDGDGLWP